jgi:membrane peptidoglycan carboxypeptidase
MSDRPTSPPPLTPEPSDSGWHQPRNPGGWRDPRPQPEDEGSWRAPQKLSPVATQEGWRVVSATAVADAPVVESETEAATAVISPEPNGAETEEEALIPHDGSEAAAVGEMETPKEPAEAVLPFEGSAAGEATLAEQISELTEQTASDEGAAAELERLDDDEDDDSFSMSELVALASLVDEQPRARLQPAAETPTAPVNPDDPAEIARRRLAELRGEAAPAASTTLEEDPALVARRMAQQLASSSPMAAVGSTPPPAPPAAPALSPADQELLAKYQTAETAIRALRSLQQAGQISRDQMQSELRQHMVRDEKGVWWMMGVESASWYRFENGDWTLATPRVLELARAAAPAAPAEDAPTVGTPVPTLDYLPDDPLPAASATPTFDEGATVRTTPIPPGMESQPLPRAVPIRDPEATIPGMPALDPYASPQSEYAQPTVASAAVDPRLVISTPAPGPLTPADAPPDYDVQAAQAPSFDKAKRAQQQSLVRTLLILGAVGFAALFALSACGIIAGVLYYQSLAAPWEGAVAALANYQPEFRTARILAADGSLIAELNSREGGARDTIPLEEISPYMIHALISTENERFYTDPGWDAIAIGRAFVQNVFAGEIESGASTLTQQIARSLVLQDSSVTASRKLQEIIIASMIAREYDKNFILELYLNEFFFGNQSYGVEAASRFYFNKSAADLNMSESAMLAGLLQAPATYDPVVNRQAAFDRMTFVLNRMATVSCLQFQHSPYLNQPFCVTRGGGGPSDIASGEVTLEKALIETANYEPRQTTVRYPHFVNYIQQIIEETYGTDAMFRGGYEIRTTLVPRIQDVAQDALLRQVQQLLNNGVQTGAVMVTDPRDGAILSMVGSPNFNDTQFEGQNNFAFLPQQPGSSLKPIVYVAALGGFTDPATGQRRYMTPATIIWDVPTTYGTNPPYTPVNFDREFHGPQSVRSSLQNSYNVPAVKAYAFVGAEVFRDVATRMGLIFQPNASFALPTALGADDVRLYEMMQAYGTLSNDGTRVPLYAITQINDFQGVQIALPQPDAPVQAIAPGLAFLMQNILSDNQARATEFGLNSGLTIPGYPDGVVGAKTGTSNDNRDLWTMGFTNNAVVGVWMGRLDNNPTTGATVTASVPVWNVVMRAALEGRPPEAFTNPGGVVQMQICAATGTMFDPNVNANCPAVGAELFLEGQPPAAANTSFVQTLAIDTWSGLRATTACPEYVETRTFANIDDPFAVQWLNSPQGQVFAQQLGLPTPLEPVPQAECPAQQQPNIRITSPTDGQQISGTINITGIISAPDFNRYQLELAPVGQDTFAIISPVNTSQVPNNGTLLQWNTTTVPNGIYRLRLAAFANNGGFIYKIVQIGVNNLAVVPTSPPIVLPTAANATAIPPDTLFPTAAATLPPVQIQIGPTVTPGLIPLGGLAPLSTPTP